MGARRKGEGGELGDWDRHIYATMYKITKGNLLYGMGNST